MSHFLNYITLMVAMLLSYGICLFISVKYSTDKWSKILVTLIVFLFAPINMISVYYGYSILSSACFGLQAGVTGLLGWKKPKRKKALATYKCLSCFADISISSFRCPKCGWSIVYNLPRKPFA